jgi:hypothetical protein
MSLVHGQGGAPLMLFEGGNAEVAAVFIRSCFRRSLVSSIYDLRGRVGEP